MTRRVLVVDDEPQIRHALGRALTRAGYEVLTVGSGDSAYASLSGTHVDAVLLDLVMPQMSGDALYLAIVRRWPYLVGRVILMSGYPDTDREHWPAELRACPLLEKPFPLEELYRIVAAVLAEPETRNLKRNSNA